VLEKWAGFDVHTCHRAVQFAGLPRSYVAAFIFVRDRGGLWIASPAVQRLAR